MKKSASAPYSGCVLLPSGTTYSGVYTTSYDMYALAECSGNYWYTYTLGLHRRMVTLNQPVKVALRAYIRFKKVENYYYISCAPGKTSVSTE